MNRSLLNALALEMVHYYRDGPARREAAARTACERIFVAETGKRLCKEMFL